MAVRFYLIPVEFNPATNSRGPKYFQWPRDPDPPALVTAPWTMIDYGVINYAILCSDVTPAQHALLAAEADVGDVPVDLDTNPTAPQVAAAQARLDAMDLPSGWVNASLTWRQIVRTVTGIMVFMQRLTAIRGINPFTNGLDLTRTYSSLAIDWQTALEQAAVNLNLSIAGLTGSSTLGQILKSFADQMAGRPFYFGELATL